MKWRILTLGIETVKTFADSMTSAICFITISMSLTSVSVMRRWKNVLLSSAKALTIA